MTEFVTAASNQEIRIILASASPRRAELLRQIGYDFEVMEADVDESYTASAPSRIVKELAEKKGAAILASLDSDATFQNQEPNKPVLILAADTIVYLDGKVLNKPKDEMEAYAMLSSLKGRKHEVFTGVCLILLWNGKKKTKLFYEKSEVYVASMRDDEIRSYIATGDPFDKAGAYGIQGPFAKHIERIKGDYFNIVGLPLHAVYTNAEMLVEKLLLKGSFLY